MIEILLLVLVTTNIVMVAISIPMINGSVPPNLIYGFRTRATLSDPNLWYPTNRHFGIWMLVTSLVNLFIAVVLYLVPGLSFETYGLVCVLFIVTGTVLTMRSSFRYLRALRKRY